MRWTRPLVLVYINIALYALCFQLQRPIMPFLVEKLGAKGADAAMSYGTLQSFFHVMQAAGSLAMGILLDRLGARWAFVICYASSAASYWLLSVSTSLTILYLSKVPTFFQAGFLVAQALIAQETDEADRATALGRATAAYTVGATLGPLLGGWLGASGDYYFGAQLAVAGSLLSVALSLLLPPSPVVDTEPKKARDDRGLTKMLRVASRPTVLLILAAKLSASVGSSVKQTIFPLVLKDGFGVAERGMGVAMSASMVANSIVGAIVIGPCERRFTPRVLMLVCILGKACCEGALSTFAPEAALLSLLPGPVHAAIPFAGCFILASVFQFALATTLTVMSTSAVGKDEQGSLMGVEHSAFSGAHIGAPTLATYLFGLGGVQLVSATCVGISVCLFVAAQAVILPRCAPAVKKDR